MCVTLGSFLENGPKQISNIEYPPFFFKKKHGELIDAEGQKPFAEGQKIIYNASTFKFLNLKDLSFS